MDFEKRVKGAIYEMLWLDYVPTRLIKMINKHGAVEAVKRLMKKPEPPEGFLKLKELNRLDLSMEQLILLEKKDHETLFDEEEFAIAKKRLDDAKNEQKLRKDENKKP